MRYGDVDVAFAKAVHMVEEENLDASRGRGMSIEARAVLAGYEAASDKLTVWSATQDAASRPQHARHRSAASSKPSGWSRPDVSGGFGTKMQFYPEESVIPAAAMNVGRPVRWFEDRREHFLRRTQERDQYWTIAIAPDGQGKILGVRRIMLHDKGALHAVGTIMPYIAAVTVPGPVVAGLPDGELVALTNKRRRPRRCAAPGGRKRCSRWSG